MKGLCPFHDEKSPSFNVTPSRGFYHCFGCGEGGDVITFVMKIDGLGFTEAVERLADKYGVQLRYEEGGATAPRSAARPAAAAARGAQGRAGRTTPSSCATPEALHGAAVPRPSAASTRTPPRTSASGSRRAAATSSTSTCARRASATRSWSPAGWSAQGSAATTTGSAAGCCGRSATPAATSIGFGARRIFDDDRIEAKYLNTPETPIYKKSQVLYGIDLARREIARASQAVVVEGYTDVMACHLAGVQTAVATCGTAFGEDHARVLRRLLHDHDEFRGEVIFTFDGDEAGQKAALRAFEGDQSFAGQTYVAVEPDGPRPVRPAAAAGRRRGPRAGRPPGAALPLRARQRRVSATTSTAPTAASTRCARPPSWSPAIRDRSKVEAFARELAGMVGVDVDDVRAEVRRAATAAATSGAARRRRRRAEPRRRRAGAARPARPSASPSSARRSSWSSSTRTSSARHGQGRRRRRLHPPDLPRGVGGVTACGGPAERAGRRRVGRQAARQRVRRAARLGAAPRWPSSRCTAKEPTTAYAAAHVYRLQELTAMRRIADLKSRLQRTNPVEHADGVQPDVRRAGRARAAPPRACASGPSAAASEAAARPRPRGARRGARARRPAARREVLAARRRPPTAPGCSAPATRWSWSTAVADARARPLGAGRGRRLGPGRRRGCGSPRSASSASPRPVARLHARPTPALLLQLIRERVTASVVLQRRVVVARQSAASP